jgi:hypothetical protein
MMRHNHSIYIIKENSLPIIYNTVSDHLSQDFAVLYAAELAKKQPASQIISNMRESGLRNVENYIRKKALVVLDWQSLPSMNKRPQRIKSAFGELSSIVEELARKRKFKKILIMSDLPVLLAESQNISALLEYERLTAGPLANMPAIEAVCCYNNSAISKMPPANFMSVLAAHRSNIHDNCDGMDWIYREWHAGFVLGIVRNAIEKALGKGSDVLVIRTLKLIYKLDENTMLSQPELFVEKLYKVLGKSAAEAVLETIVKDLRAEMQGERKE